jgi:hypothetical protein
LAGKMLECITMGRIMYSRLLIRYCVDRSMLPKMTGHGDEGSAAEYFEINLADVIESVRKINLNKLDI